MLDIAAIAFHAFHNLGLADLGGLPRMRLPLSPSPSPSLSKHDASNLFTEMHPMKKNAFVS
jgi:hypothetical protein